MKKIKDSFTITGGMTYTKKEVQHLKGYVDENNWQELKSKLINSDTAKEIYGFTERNGNLIIYSFEDKRNNLV